MNALPKVGDKVKITQNNTQHNYTLGKVYVVGAVYRTGHWMNRFVCYDPATDFIGNLLQCADAELQPLTREYFSQQVNTLRTALKKAEETLHFMQTSNLDAVTAEQLAAFQALAVLDQKDTSMLDRVDRLAMLAKLLK